MDWSKGSIRFVLAALTIAPLVLPAQAQRGRGKQQSTDTQQLAEKKKKAEEAEKAYKEALKGIPVQKPADPWAKIK